MGLFSRKDWNVIAITFERTDAYRVNGNRAKGGAAVKTRDGAKSHSRTLLWGVFDQQGKLLESAPGRGSGLIGTDVLSALTAAFRTNRTVLHVLKLLETGETEKAAKPLEWDGYPQKGG
jgi:hypothetical protein